MDINIFGKPFWLYGIEGTVYGLRMWTSTSVQTSGPTITYETGPGVYTSHGPKVTSTVNQHQECWIKSLGGRQKQLLGTYALADTQIVQVVWGALKGVEVGNNLVVRNVSTGAGWTVNGSLPFAITGHGVWRLTGQYIVAILISIAVVDTFWWMNGLPPSHSLLGNPHAPDYSRLIVSAFGIAFLLGLAGFIHRTRLMNSNHRQAMAIIQKAITDNPDFLKSLEK
ncbi:hypothetical protein A0U92_01095 [Acetobacter aceti]|uniref:Uncharacterized protein n=1 Tax=Acetobacter aceti TaxID=435 RepID=A0A1U9KCR2_ACEAC|nr:hypothetical protein [Acetobacter aceti]AQS83594.1 hypothetical protein A0U92_01095 [Acetobacter aceti]